MTILRTITCDIKECSAQYTEPFENAGFHGWGHIQGLMDQQPDGTIKRIAYLCPSCLLNKILPILNGE